MSCDPMSQLMFGTNVLARQEGVNLGVGRWFALLTFKKLTDLDFGCRFSRPILHGLCTMGYAVRAIVRGCCNGEPTRVQSFQGRFLSHVFPGEKLTTEMWLDAHNSRCESDMRATSIVVLCEILARFAAF